MNDSPLCSSISAALAIVGDYCIEAETGFAAAAVAGAFVAAIVSAELGDAAVAPSIVAAGEGIVVLELPNCSSR